MITLYSVDEVWSKHINRNSRLVKEVMVELYRICYAIIKMM